MHTAYQKLKEHYALIGKLAGADALLFWDRAVVMPAESAPAHAEIAGALAAVIAEKGCDPRIGEWLDQARSQCSGLNPWDTANLAGMERQYKLAVAVPPALQSRRASHAAALQQTWQQARAASEFALFAPGMAEMLEIQKEVAAHRAQALGLAPYDAMMEEHDPGMTCDMVDSVVAPLSRELPGLLDEVLEKQKSWKPEPLPHCSLEHQRELFAALVRQMGYDFGNGRLDETTHPFATVGVPGDTRITTRYKHDDLRFGLSSTVHELGHSLYEYHLPREWAFQPVGAARGATVHESQALMLEMSIGQSAEFIGWWAPQLAQRRGNAAAFAPGNLTRSFQRIQRNLIRIEADEVAYPLHVMLRYDLERALLGGDLAVRDLPDAWNQKMRQYIGITPPNDALGCLQDMHWSIGLFGYFPSYLMGAALAAQLFSAATRSDPEMMPAVARGDFGPCLAWSRGNIHRKASSESFGQLVEAATGKPLGAESLLAHLRHRYLGAAS